MKPSLLVVVFTLLLSACAETYPPLSIGEKVDFALLQDQFANHFPHADSMELLIYTDDMKASREVRDSLRQIDPACYEQGRVVFVADVSGMPGMITKLIAVPKMRGYGFPVWLDYDGEATEALPLKEDHISVVGVEQKQIKKIEFVNGKEALMNILIPLCGYAEDQVAVNQVQ